MTILLEDLTESILIEQGVTPLLGMDLTTSLGMTWKNMERIFVKSAKEFSRWKPRESEIVVSAGSQAILPEDFVSIKAVRYNLLYDLPRFMFTKFDEANIQWDPSTRILKVFPPIDEVRVSYVRELQITNNFQVTDKNTTVEGEDVVEDILSGMYRSGTLTVTKNSKTMSVLNVNSDNTVANLEGDLGTGTIDLVTREYVLNLLDTSAGQIRITYYPKYKGIVDLDMTTGDKIFPRLYASHLLTSIAAVRAQATQEVLHNIDITTDELSARAQVLKMEVTQMLKSSFPFSAVAPW